MKKSVFDFTWQFELQNDEIYDTHAMSTFFSFKKDKHMLDHEEFFPSIDYSIFISVETLFVLKKRENLKILSHNSYLFFWCVWWWSVKMLKFFEKSCW